MVNTNEVPQLPPPQQLSAPLLSHTPPRETHQVNYHLQPLQFTTLRSFSKRYGLSQNTIVHMLIDQESETPRLPRAITKALKNIRAALPTPPAPTEPTTPAAPSAFQNN